jgi:hypothetical protein
VIVLVLLRVLIPHCTLQRGRLLPLTEGLLSLFCPALLHSEEVSRPKTIIIKQYLNTNNFSVNNRHVVIKSSQATQLDITKVFYREFNFHYCMKNLFRQKYWKNLHFLIQINHVIKTRCNTTHLLFYFICFRWHST